MQKRVSQKEIIFEPVFNRKNKLNKNGEAVIEIRAYKERVRVFVSTKIFIRPSQWDKSRKRIKSNHPQADILNGQINLMLSTFEKMQTEKIIKNTPFYIDEFRRNSTINVSTQSFLEFMEEQININTKNNKETTKRSHINTINLLRKFKNGNNVQFSEVNYSFIEGFLKFLQVESLANNTIHKHWKILKYYIDIAIDKDLMTSKNPCKSFKISEKQTERFVLSLEEITKLQSLDFSNLNEKVAITRDMFLFACYTGLRISDVTRLTNESATKGKSGWELKFRSYKGDKPVNLPLYLLFASHDSSKKSKSEELFEKYYNVSEKYVFPIRTEQIINRELKGIADLIGIDFNLTFHVGRHTFGTYMATKVPIPILRELMQHSDIRTTMMYVHINDEMVKKGLLKVDWEF